MAITSAIMQMRRGNEVDFDPDKMLPGEWAVSTDKKIVRMCFYPGVCVRMATYEAFEEDMKQIQTILTEARTIQEAVTRINTEVSANAKAVAEYTKQAKQYRDEAKMYKEQASAIVGVDIATETVPGLIAGGDNAVSENGTLMLTKVTTDRTLLKSKAGGLKINSIEGESRQDGTPSPDAEAKIKSVEVKEIKGVGKNLLKNTMTSKTVNGGTVTVNADKSITLNGTFTTRTILNINGAFNITDRNTIATISSQTITGVYHEIVKMKTDGTLGYLSNGIGSPVKSNLNEGEYIKQYNIIINQNVTLNNLKLYPMIEKGSTATDYEPYHEKAIQLSALITLRGIGAVKDTICKKNGVYGVKGKIKELDLSTVKDWFREPTWTNNPSMFVNYNFLSDGANVASGSTGNLKCNRLKNRNAGNMTKSVMNGIAQEGKSLFVSIEGIETSADLVSYFAENETYMFYPLAKPTFEPLPLADQIALHQLETFDTVTYISTDSTIEPVIEVEYGTSKVGAYALEAKLGKEADNIRITALEAVVLSLGGNV